MSLNVYDLARMMGSLCLTMGGADLGCVDMIQVIILVCLVFLLTVIAQVLLFHTRLQVSAVAGSPTMA